MSAAVCIQFGGNAVRFAAEDPALLAPLEVHLRGCAASESLPLVSEFHLTAVSRTSVQVVENGSVLFPALERETAWQVLLQEGLARLNAACRLGPVFHAGAVRDARGGVILCGGSGCGKSTLTAYLLTRGFRYLSDEVILWESAQGQIRGFARSLVLKPGAAFLWQGHAQGRAKRLPFADGSAWLEPRTFSAQAICRQTRPRLLLFPQYRTDAPPLRVRPLSPAESLFRLLQNLVNARNLPALGMQAAAELARQVPACAIEYASLEAVHAWIQTH